MSQTMTLSEPLLGLARRNSSRRGRQVDRRSPSRCARVACNGFGDLLLAFGMVLLAPVAVLLLAGAFVLACWRMQWLDGSDPADRAIAKSNPVTASVPTIETAKPRFLPVPQVQSAHLWN